MKPIVLVVAGAVALALSACTDIRQEDLVLKAVPNCDEAAMKKGDWHYWVFGTPRPVVNWSGCDKSGADLQDAYLGSSTLINTNLSNANLENADLGAAYLRGTNLSNANLRNVDLTAVYGVDVDLSGADLTGTVRHGGTYTNVDLSGATWSDGETICEEGSMNRCK